MKAASSPLIHVTLVEFNGRKTLQPIPHLRLKEALGPLLVPENQKPSFLGISIFRSCSLQLKSLQTHDDVLQIHYLLTDT